MPGSEYPVELSAPDISAHEAGNTGIPFVTRVESARPGPHVVINAVTHGNEVCGAIVVDRLLRDKVKPLLGTLTLSFANVAAYRQFDPRHPDASRFVDEDFNRLWDVSTLEGPRQSAELTRAREFRPLIDAADFLLDIHSMQHATPALCLSGTTRKGKELAVATAVPHWVVMDKGHAAGKRMRDYLEFGEEAGRKAALLVECGQHWEKNSETVAYATTLRFLKHFGMVDDATMKAYGVDPAPPPPQEVIEITQAVTVASDKFEFVAPYKGFEKIEKAGTVLGHDGDKPVYTPYDNCILIMPSRRLVRGQTAVRLGRVVS